MLILRKEAFARAGLLGNPSDGYHGKTMSIVVANFRAAVVLYEWEDVEVVQTNLDQSRFGSVHDLVRDVQLHGYYGGMRLLKATIKKFVEYCSAHGHDLHCRNFSLRYESDIPRQVGLAGSSAIIVAALRCLMEFYEIDIPLRIQPSLALAVEHDELGIVAGLQDRVIQVYEGLVHMDFSQEIMRKTQQELGLGCGQYEELDPNLLPHLYVAYDVAVSEPTEIFHNDLRGRFERGEPSVVAAMKKFADLADQGRDALLAGDSQKLHYLIDENFNTRKSICRLPRDQVKMVETARAAGASAKFAGSGGAIVGTYDQDEMYQRLTKDLGDLGCQVIKPVIIRNSTGPR